MSGVAFRASPADVAEVDEIDHIVDEIDHIDEPGPGLAALDAYNAEISARCSARAADPRAALAEIVSRHREQTEQLARLHSALPRAEDARRTAAAAVESAEGELAIARDLAVAAFVDDLTGKPAETDTLVPTAEAALLSARSRLDVASRAVDQIRAGLSRGEYDESRSRGDLSMAVAAVIASSPEMQALAAEHDALVRRLSAVRAALAALPAAAIPPGLRNWQALSRWDGFTLFVDDGRVEIDSNTVERSMRPIVLTRKNALFAGSDEGAENWAVLASLIETCKLHSVNPEAYFTDVLTRLVNNWPNSRLAELLPWAWIRQAD